MLVALVAKFAFQYIFGISIYFLALEGFAAYTFEFSLNKVIFTHNLIWAISRYTWFIDRKQSLIDAFFTLTELFSICKKQNCRKGTNLIEED
jgi:hypothetical protein